MKRQRGPVGIRPTQRNNTEASPPETADSSPAVESDAVTATADPAASESDANETPGTEDTSSVGSRYPVHKQPEIRTLNTRFLLVSAAIVAAAGGGIWFTHYLQKSRIAEDLRAEATRAAEENPDRAQRQLREYLQIERDDLETRIELARLQMANAETSAQWFNAFQTNEEILRTDPDQEEIRRQQVQVSFRLGRFADAQANLEKLIEKRPDEGGLHLLMAIAHQGESRYREAIREYSLAVADENFESVEVLDDTWTAERAYFAQARIAHEQLDDPIEADRLFRKLMKRFPDSAEAHLLHAVYHHENERIEEASASARKALELDPENHDALVAAAEFSLQDPDSSDETLVALRDALDESAEDSETARSELYLLRAAYEKRLGTSEQAIAILEDGVEENPEQTGLLSMLVGELVAEDRLEEAEQHLKVLRKDVSRYGEAYAKFLNGQYLLKERKPAEAIAELRRAGTLAQSNPRLLKQANLAIGNCYLLMGQPELALQEFTRLRRADSGDHQATQAAAVALSALGRFEEAVGALRDVPVSDAETALALARGELQLVGTTPPNRRDWRRVEDALQSARDYDASSAELAILEATVLVAKGRTGDARSVLEGAWNVHPENPQLAVALSQAAFAEQNLSRAREVLEAISQRTEGSPAVDAMWLVYWSLQDKQRFETLLGELSEKSYPDEEWANRLFLLETIAAYRVQQRQLPAAVDLLLTIAEERRDHVESWFRVVGPALDTGDDQSATRATLELERLDGESGPYARCAQAMARIKNAVSDEDDVELERLRSELEDVIGLRSNWAPPYVLLGRLALRAEDRREAAEMFSQAITYGNRDPEIMRLASQLLLDQMKVQEATELFARVRDTTRGDLRNTVTQITAGLLAAQNREAEALELARANTAQPDAKALDYVILGQLLWANNEAQDAEQQFRKALEVDPAHPNAWLAVVELLVRQGRRSEAEQALSEAETELRKANRVIALARCYELLGQFSDAEAAYRAEYEANPKNGPALHALAAFYARTGRSSQAEQLIRPAVAAPEEYERVDLVGLRRLLAGAIAFSSYAGFEEALDLLDQNIAQTVNRSDDQRLKARLLVSRLYPDDMRTGLQLFEIVNRRIPLNATEQAMIAQAHDRLEDYVAAEPFWEQLLSDQKSNWSVLAAYVRRQARLGQLKDLDSHLDRLQRLDGKPLETMVVLAEVDLLREDAESGLQRLEKYRTEGEDDNERIDRTMQVSQLLTVLTELPLETEVRETVQQYLVDQLKLIVPSRPTAVVMLAEVLGEQGQLKEALDYLEQYCENPRRTGVAIALLQNVASDHPQLARVEQWVKDLLTATPSVSVMHMYECLLRKRRQYDEAISVNRRILGAEPTHIVALNNLAWLESAHRGDHAEALRLIERAMEQAGPTHFLLDTRGQVYLASGRPEAAIDDFRDSWIQNKTPSTRFHIARALAQFGDVERARDHLQDALDSGLRPQSLEAPEVDALQELKKELNLTKEGA